MNEALEAKRGWGQSLVCICKIRDTKSRGSYLQGGLGVEQKWHSWEQRTNMKSLGKVHIMVHSKTKYKYDEPVIL